MLKTQQSADLTATSKIRNDQVKKMKMQNQALIDPKKQSKATTQPI